MEDVQRPMRRTTLPLLLLAVLALTAAGLAGCGDDDEATRTTDDTSTPGDDGGGGGSDDGGPGEGSLVITVDVHGGFVPVERSVADTADVVVVGDGRVISPAPVIAIFPGVALQPYQVGRIEESEVAELAGAVESLDPDADYAPPGPATIADAPDTTVRLERDGEVVREVSANALGMVDETGPRAALAAVVERINGVVGVTGEEPYEPVSLEVHDITDLAGEPPSSTTVADPDAPEEPTGRILEWPLAHDGRACTVVAEAAEVAAVLEVLAGANQLDWFATDAGVRRLVVAPVLPGDDPCPGAG
jgi:hypothetical protein